MNPIGVGFLDLNPEGLFHLERMRLRPDFRCLTGWNNGPSLVTAHSLLEQTATSPQEIIHDPRIGLLWIGPHADSSLIGSALAAGKHVLVGLPVGAAAHDWRSWGSGVRASHRSAQLCVATLHRWDSQFRTVQQLVRTADLGQIVDLRHISRQYVPIELELQSTAANCSVGSVAQRELRWQHSKWFELLDQLLLLVSDPVASVVAHSSGVSRGQRSSERPGRCVLIEFITGCQAWLELNRHSLAPLETGWIIDGTKAGYGDGKTFRSSPDCELIDVPLEELSTDQAAFYDALAATIRDGEDFPVTADSIDRVLELSDLIEKSILTGCRVQPDLKSGDTVK